MKTPFLILVGLILAHTSNGHAEQQITDFDEYFDLKTDVPVHVPIQSSKLLPEDESKRLGDLLGLGYLEYGARLSAECKIPIGGHVTGYVVLDESYYRQSFIFIVDDRSGNIFSQEKLFEEAFDAGYGETTKSWLVDVDEDGYLDVIRIADEVELNFKKLEEDDVEEYFCTRLTIDLLLYSPDSHSFDEAKDQLGLLDDSRFDEILDEIEEGCPEIKWSNSGD